MDDAKNNPVENGAASEVYEKILHDYARQSKGRTGFDAVCPPEDQFRSAFVEALSERTGRANGDELDQVYNEIHAKNLAEFLTRNRVPPRDFGAVLGRYKSVLRLDEQVDRVLPERPSSLLGIIPGYGPERALRKAKDAAAVLASTKERVHLTDEETKALIQASLSQSARLPLYHAAGLGLTAWLCWRGRSAYRFPFFKPNPAQQQFLAGSRYGHAYRGLAYFTVYAVFGVPFVTSMSTSGFFVTVARDPRLKELLQRPRPSAARPGQWGPGRSDDSPSVLEANQRRSQTPFVAKYGRGGQSEGPEASRDFDDEALRQAPGEQEAQRGAQSMQRQSHQSASRTSQYQSSRDEEWDAPSDQDDDASPRAWSSQNQQSTSGSAWDRVRRQSGYVPGQAQGGQSPGSAESSANAWGASAGTSPEYRGSRDSYSYSGADEGKVEVKSQAQRDFDALLERERGGTDQEQSTWSRK